MNSPQKEIYYDVIAGQMPRLLGLLDRSPGSPSYGCFDRQYWHYRVIDFASARLQESALTLALMYSINLQDNIYFKNHNILDWINASVGFWCKIQQTNGSFNEWYPGENSFVATAFTSYAISETLIVLGSNLIEEYALIVSCLRKAGDWLIPRVECRAVNQTAGAAIALYNIFLLTKESKYLTASQDKIYFLKEIQNSEGWFLEYGGADIGYLSLAIDYIAKYFQKTNHADALEILKKSISFISNFIYANYSFGGSYASRNTEYVIPSGFEIMADILPESSFLLEEIRRANLDKKTITPDFFDDRYLLYLGYNYLQAFLCNSDKIIDKRPQLPNAVIQYPNLGTTIIRKEYFCIVCNYRKGGNFKITFSNGKVIDDWGVILELRRGKKYFSGWLNYDSTYREDSDSFFVIQTSFQKVEKIVFKPLKFITMRLFVLTVGLVPGITGWLKNKLRDIIIIKQAKTPCSLTRTFNLYDQKIVITDKVEKGKDIKKITVGAKISYIFVPSSSYFQISDLSNQCNSYTFNSCDSAIVIMREYGFDGSLLNTEVKTLRDGVI